MGLIYKGKYQFFVYISFNYLYLKAKGVRENYREAMYIGLTMGFTVCIFLVWILGGFIAPTEYQVCTRVANVMRDPNKLINEDTWKWIACVQILVWHQLLPKHSENLRHWNSKKSLKRFWILFPNLLDGRITKISRKLKSHNGFKRADLTSAKIGCLMGQIGLLV